MQGLTALIALIAGLTVVSFVNGYAQDEEPLRLILRAFGNVGNAVLHESGNMLRTVAERLTKTANTDRGQAIDAFVKLLEQQRQ